MLFVCTCVYRQHQTVFSKIEALPQSAKCAVIDIIDIETSHFKQFALHILF